MWLVAAELHAGGAAVFGADQVAARDAERIEEAPDVGRQLLRGEAVVLRCRRRAEAGQVGPHHAILAGEMRYPLRPGARGFRIAVDHYDHFGRGPGRAEPMVLVGHGEAGPQLDGGHGVSSIRIVAPAPPSTIPFRLVRALRQCDRRVCLPAVFSECYRFRRWVHQPCAHAARRLRSLGVTMQRPGFLKFVLAGAAAITIVATANTFAENQKAAPTTVPQPTSGPADPKLRAIPLPDGKTMHLLPATLETTQWGWFNNAQPPVLRVKSGDTIVLETMMHSHNQVVPGATIEQIKKTRTDFPGRGPHTLTGPIYIEGAEPGDVLRVKINKIVPRAYAANFNVPGMFGQFPNVYTDGQVKYMYLDLEKMTTEFLPGVVIPLRPFPGTLAVARKEPGRYSSVPPGEYAGNLDIRDMVAGTSLYVPVHVPGALLWTGDSHAGQGNGEINLTAIETAYKEFNITVEVIKGRPFGFPRIETPKSWITMGFDPDLNKAWDQAKAETVKFLSEQRGISAYQAATAMPTVSDCRVSQVVNVKKGIHCLSPKNVNDKEDMERPTAETAQYYVTHVKDADLNKAMNDASMAMIKFLENEKKIARLDAYGLASVAMDCRVGAISDAEKNVYCVIPKSIWQTAR